MIYTIYVDLYSVRRSNVQHSVSHFNVLHSIVPYSNILHFNVLCSNILLFLMFYVQLFFVLSSNFLVSNGPYYNVLSSIF